jgi:hypothetical protein
MDGRSNRLRRRRLVEAACAASALCVLSLLLAAVHPGHRAVAQGQGAQAQAQAAAANPVRPVSLVQPGTASMPDDEPRPDPTRGFDTTR